MSTAFAPTAGDISSYDTNDLIALVEWADDVLAGRREAHSGTLTVRAVRDVCSAELELRADESREQL